MSDRELVLKRVLDAPRHNVWRCWTEPELLKQWFAPKPWTTPFAEFELRAGGASLIVMRGPDGQDFPNPGIFLEVVRQERLVFTDAYTKAWEPSQKPFMTAILNFSDAPGGRTQYDVSVMHWSAEDRNRHEAMGFETGWGLCAQQLEQLASTLP